MRKSLPNKTFLAVAAFLLFFTAGPAEAGEARELKIFYSPGCHRCAQVKDAVIPVMEKKFSGRIRVVYSDISEVENYKTLLGLREKYCPGLKITVPVFYISGRMINTEGLTVRSLEEFISAGLAVPEAGGAGLPEIDLLSRFRALKLFTIVGLGLVDGINPCAFTVIVFFISFLSAQGYARRQFIAIGLVFISAVFITYVLIGLGAFAFLYRLNEFWQVSRVVNRIIGAFSIAVGALALYDFFKFRKTGQTEGLALQLPKPVKDQIHRIIGMHYRVNKNIPASGASRRIGGLIISALATGFLVTLLEAVCTGQTYLPTITFVLKTTQFKLQAFVYLLVYNLMFILPLLAIFIFALLGATSAQFSDFLKKHLSPIKILMALMFFGLGIFLLWRA